MSTASARLPPSSRASSEPQETGRQIGARQRSEAPWQAANSRQGADARGAQATARRQPMSDVPVQVIVAAFNDVDGASKALKSLQEAKHEALIGIQDAAVITKDANGKV